MFPVKPVKCSVYVKLVSAMLDVSVSLVQLPFGQVACLSKSLAVGTGPELSDGTSSRPFFNMRFHPSAQRLHVHVLGGLEPALQERLERHGKLPGRPRRKHRDPLRHG